MPARSIVIQESPSLIGRQWHTSDNRAHVCSPVDGSIVETVYQATPETVDEAVGSSLTAWQSWREVPAYERAEQLHALATGIGRRAEDFAAQMTAETGKPIKDSRGEVARSLATMRISAEEAKRLHGDMIPMDAVPNGTGRLGFTLRAPVGVVACITPFNAPLNMTCHKVGPALAGGNVVVLKPHVHGAGVSVLLAQVALETGIPEGVINLVQGETEAGQALTTHPNVAFVNFTGSGRVAEHIVAQIGLKRTLMELGGNAPTIVHKDADLERAARLVTAAAFGLSGQSCVSTQRVLVHAEVVDTFLDLFVKHTKSLRVGDPWDETTDIGPVLDAASADRVQTWVQQAVNDGATLVLGGTRDGCYIQPTILTNVTARMEVSCDEIFGPVAAVTTYDSLDHAIAQANDTPWGLKAGIFTESLDVALRAAQRLEYGTVNINAPSRSRLDQEPSGGTKASGWGREGPRYAMYEMTDVRMVSLPAVGSGR